MATASLPASTVIPNTPTVRRTAKFHPSVWGDTFVSYTPDETILARWRERACVLRGEIQEILHFNDTSNKIDCTTLSSRLSLVDHIQRLGIAYQFEEQIEYELARVFVHFRDLTHDHDDCCGDNLRVVSLSFRLLREHGYNIQCDVFKKFMDDKGNFKQSIKEDVDGLLSLYEAAHLKIHGEPILDLALTSANTCLRSMLPHLDPLYTKKVVHALHHPIHKGLPRLDSVFYFSIYEEMEQSNKTLLEFAKLDFNIVQKLHLQELSTLSKWWKELDFASKLPFARDRLVEGYFWILGVYFEPKYSLSRMFISKLFTMTSVVDDIYDAYGTKEELCLLTKAIERLDESAIVELPEYMKVYYQELLALYRNMDKEMTQQNKPIYGLEYSKESMKSLTRSYYEQTKWLGREEFPTFKEYMDVGLVSSGYPFLLISSLVGMDDIGDEASFEWLLKGPKMNEASTLIARLMNDVMSHQFERERGHSPSGVECFTREHGVSEDEARKTLKMKAESAWEDVNEGLMRPTPVPRPLLMRILNFTRMIEVLYEECDSYTHVNATVKGYIVSMLSTEAQV